MTITATFVLAADTARKLADSAAEDAALDAAAVDVHELAGGRVEVTFTFVEVDTAAKKALTTLAAAVAGRDTRPEWQTLAAADWVSASRAARPPVRAGRFLVHEASDHGKARPNDLAIVIEAGQAFGTGHHGTTRGCLLAIEAAVRRRRPRAALDIGTGSGVLAIALAKLGVPTLATDIDPIAVSIARENAQANGVGRLVRVIPMPGIAGLLPHGGPRGGYDIIVANILMGPLLTLAPAIARALAPRGGVILSGLTADQGRRVTGTYRAAGLRPVRTSVLDGWLTLTMARA